MLLAVKCEYSSPISIINSNKCNTSQQIHTSHTFLNITSTNILVIISPGRVKRMLTVKQKEGGTQFSLHLLMVGLQCWTLNLDRLITTHIWYFCWKTVMLEFIRGAVIFYIIIYATVHTESVGTSIFVLTLCIIDRADILRNGWLCKTRTNLGYICLFVFLQIHGKFLYRGGF